MMGEGKQGKNLEEHRSLTIDRSNPMGLWRLGVVLTAIALSTTIYIAVCTNIPVVIWTGLKHEDGLYISHGVSIAAGEWLGPYNQFTLVKDAGYPIFLAFASLFRLPVPLAESLFYVLATSAVATVAFRFTRSYFLFFLVFEILLWNFGPVTGRIISDNIYCSLFLLSFSLLILLPEFGMRNQPFVIALAGLFWGWLWISREEGIVALPEFALVIVYFAILSFRLSYRRWRLFLLAATFVASALLPLTLVSFANLEKYGSFANVDTGGHFEAALNSLQSIQTNHRNSFLPVSYEMREKAYTVSPAFARLRRLFEESGSPIRTWQTVGCSYIPTTCGDYASDWFRWAFRDAVALSGKYKDAQSSSQYYQQVRDDLKQACDAKKFACRSTFWRIMPQLSSIQIGALPRSFSRLISILTFKDPPSIQQTAEIGTMKSVRSAATFLNIERQAGGRFVGKWTNPYATYALRVKVTIVSIYSRLLRYLIRSGFLAFVAVAGIYIYMRKCPPIIATVAVAWIAVVLRLFLLALVDVSVFPTVFYQYISYAFPLSCFASLVSWYLLIELFLSAIKERVVQTDPGFRS